MYEFRRPCIEFEITLTLVCFCDRKKEESHMAAPPYM